MSVNIVTQSLPDLIHLRTALVRISLRPFEDVRPGATRGTRSRRNLQCRAVTGGSRRDVEKLIARTQHRRPRHRKGAQPSKRDLMQELEEEIATEEEVIAELPSGDNTSSPSQIISTEPSEKIGVEDQKMGDQVPEASQSQALDEVDSNSSKTSSEGQKIVENVIEGLDRQAGNAMSEAEKRTDEAGASVNEAASAMNAVSDIVMDTVSDTGKKVGETGQEVGQDLSEVVSIGRGLLEDGGKAISKQAEENQARARETLKEEGEILEQGGDRVRSQAQKSLDRVQESVTRAVQESARAAESIGREASVFGEIVVDAAKETIKATSKVPVKDNSREDGMEKGNDSLREEKKSEQLPSKENNRYVDFKVLVAGASGRTGRLIAENLVSKGATVRALVRDAYKARSIEQLKNCEVVEADLYKYETLRKALGDCNVVICAIGARAFPLDPFNTFQVEYEGVLNLVSAAKNQGKIKKFVLISTIGVTYFQLIPLLFWKKQAELYLQRSGLDYTIVRPGGLKSSDNETEQVVMQGPDSQVFGGISRAKVAEISVTALLASGASDKIVEVVAVSGKQKRNCMPWERIPQVEWNKEDISCITRMGKQLQVYFSEAREDENSPCNQ